MSRVSKFKKEGGKVAPSIPGKWKAINPLATSSIFIKIGDPLPGEQSANGRLLPHIIFS